MEATMGRRATFDLTPDERETLERWARRPKSAQALALRCRIVLAAADGENTIDIAARLGCSRGTVSKWRGRFAERGLAGLWAQAPPGRHLQVVARPPVHRQGPRHRRALPQSAGRCGRVVPGREVP